jgi:hypothetical protein
MQALIQSENLLSVAQRSGGPRLSAGFDTGAGSATNAAYPGDPYSSDGNIYPGDTTPVPDTDNTYYPPTGSTTGSTTGTYGEAVNWGAPLRIRDLGNGTGTILAPVPGVARWAGARLTTSGRTTTIARGSNRLQLNRNSTVAILNGRSATMSAPAQVVNGTLYAPLAYLAAAVGAQATLDGSGDTISLRLDGRDAGYISVPER